MIRKLEDTIDPVEAFMEAAGLERTPLERFVTGDIPLNEDNWHMLKPLVKELILENENLHQEVNQFRQFFIHFDLLRAKTYNEITTLPGESLHEDF